MSQMNNTRVSNILNKIKADNNFTQEEYTTLQDILKKYIEEEESISNDKIFKEHLMMAASKLLEISSFLEKSFVVNNIFINENSSQDEINKHTPYIKMFNSLKTFIFNICEEIDFLLKESPEKDSNLLEF